MSTIRKSLILKTKARCETKTNSKIVEDKHFKSKEKSKENIYDVSGDIIGWIIMKRRLHQTTRHCLEKVVPQNCLLEGRGYSREQLQRGQRSLCGSYRVQKRRRTEFKANKSEKMIEGSKLLLCCKIAPDIVHHYLVVYWINLLNRLCITIYQWQIFFSRF